MNTRISFVMIFAAVAACPLRAQDHVWTLPDQPGQILKMTRETVRLGNSHDPEERVNLFLASADERVRELREMQAAGRASHNDALERAIEKTLTRGASGAIENGAAQGWDMGGAVDRYVNATAKHFAVLQDVLSKAPPQARKGLERAIEASRHGHEQAIAAHERGRGRWKENPKGGRGPGWNRGNGRDENPGRARGHDDPPPGRGHDNRNDGADDDRDNRPPGSGRNDDRPDNGKGPGKPPKDQGKRGPK